MSMSLGLGLDLTMRRGSLGGGGGVPATAPAQITGGQWTLVDSPSVGGDKLSLDIMALPSDGGSAITALQYSIGGGAWTSLAGTGTGARLITVLATTLASVQVRAVNAVGNGTASTAKTATPTVATTVPDALTVGQWTLSDVPSAGGDTLSINITALPSDGGSTITALEYRIGGGSAVALSGTGTGARSITVPATTLASIEVRAVNAIGNAAWSDTKTATPSVLSTTPAAFQSVNADGWSVTETAPPTFDPVASPVYATVTRSGYLNGLPVSVAEDIISMARIRQAYPSEASLTTDQVAISDFIYAGETVAGSPTNNSTRAYPMCLAMWLNHDLERATSSTHTLRLAVAHGYARNGKPVDSVEFIISDGTTTVTQLVTAMSVISYSATGLSAPHFAAAMDLSTLTQGALLTVDAIINPWVGDAFQISVDADTYPSPNLTTLRLLNDRTGGYGTAYAYVDSTLGDNGTAVTSATHAAALAAPYLTIAAAAAGINAYNAANFGRSSDAGGGIIRLVEGTHTHSNFKTAGTGVTIPLVIEAADLSKTSTTIWQDTGVNQTNTTPTLLKIKGLTLRKTGASISFIDCTGGVNARLITEDCVWDLNGKSIYGAWIYRVGIFTQINCAGDAGQTKAFATSYKVCINIGAGTMGDATIHAICSTGSRLDAKAVNASMPASVGFFCGWNKFSATSGSNRLIGVDVPQGARGFAVVGNTVESAGSHVAPALQLAGDSNAMIVENAVIMGNTVAGERTNIMYLDGGANNPKSGYVKFNVFAGEFNIKSDVFATNSANTGNWPTRYKTGFSDNVALSHASNGAGYGPSKWLGEIPAIREVAGGTPLFANDQSHDGGNAGGGDYAPTAGTSIPFIPSGLAPYPYDLFGQAIANDGSAYIGAVQA